VICLQILPNILNRWWNYFCQLLNVHGINDVKRREIHIAEPLVTEPRPFEIEIANENLKRYKSWGTDQISSEMIQARDNILHSEIHKLINSIWNREQLPQQRNESIIIPVYKKGDKTDCSNHGGISLLPTTYKMLSNILVSRLTPYVDKIIGDDQCGFRHNR
jgi:hypothetical protein